MALHLTPAGETVRDEIIAEREILMISLIAPFSAGEQQQLSDLLAKLFQGVAREDTHKLRMCRLCDGSTCGPCPIHVPVGSEAVQTYRE